MRRGRRRRTEGTRLGLSMSECKDCADPVRFVKMTATGRWMVVNPAENVSGTVCAAKVGHELHGWVVSKTHPARQGFLRFTPHAATCSAIERPEPPEPHPTLPILQEEA